MVAFVCFKQGFIFCVPWGVSCFFFIKFNNFIVISLFFFWKVTREIIVIENLKYCVTKWTSNKSTIYNYIFKGGTYYKIIKLPQQNTEFTFPLISSLKFRLYNYIYIMCIPSTPLFYLWMEQKFIEIFHF